MLEEFGIELKDNLSTLEFMKKWAEVANAPEEKLTVPGKYLKNFLEYMGFSDVIVREDDKVDATVRGKRIYGITYEGGNPYFDQAVYDKVQLTIEMNYEDYERKGEEISASIRI